MNVNIKLKYDYTIYINYLNFASNKSYVNDLITKKYYI